MHIMKPTLMLVAAGFFMTFPVTAAMSSGPTAVPETVQFARGTTSKTIRVTICGDQSKIYQIGLRAGQKASCPACSCHQQRHVQCYRSWGRRGHAHRQHRGRQL